MCRDTSFVRSRMVLESLPSSQNLAGQPSRDDPVSRILLAAAIILLATSCSDRARPPATDLRPIFDLSRLPDSLAIDGDATDWGGSGICVTAFAEDAAPPIDPALLSADLRLGWNARGLAVLVRLRSSLPWQEAAEARLAYNADSVELFLRRGSEWKELVQPVIAPGMAPDQPDLRTFIYDYRGKTTDWAGVATAIEVTRRRQLDGYLLEALIPWAQLRLQAAPGTTCEFAIKLNKLIPGQGRRQLCWMGPTSDMFQRLRLAEAGTWTVAKAAWLVRDGTDRLAACAIAPVDAAGSILSVTRGGDELARTTLSVRAGRAVASVAIEAPAPGEPPLVLSWGGQQAGQLKAPDVALESRLLLEGAASLPRWWLDNPRVEQVRFRVPALLTGPDLPQPLCAEPSIARRAGVIGAEVRWFAADRSPVTRAERPGRYGAVITVRCATGDPVIFHQTCVRLPADLPTNAIANDVLHQFGVTATPDLSSGIGRDRLGRHLAQQLTSDNETAVLLAGLLESAADGKPARALARDRTWWQALRTDLGTATTHRWFRHLPTGYEQDQTKRWPAVIYLHGSGGSLPRDYQPFEKRNANADLLGWAKGKDLPLAIYALQASCVWEPPAVLAALDRILAEDRIDPDRVVLMGFSMGAIGTWDCVVDHPERFAGAVPIGGRGYRAGDVAGIAGRLPVWAFNGDKDLTTTLEDAQKVVSALTAAGGDVRLTVLPGAGHVESMTDTFNTPGLWEWVLARRIQRP